jgi:hypothetical protein
MTKCSWFEIQGFDLRKIDFDLKIRLDLKNQVFSPKENNCLID